MNFIFWPYCWWKNGIVTSNMAPAHPNATGVAVYPALLEWQINIFNIILKDSGWGLTGLVIDSFIIVNFLDLGHVKKILKFYFDTVNKLVGQLVARLIVSWLWGKNCRFFFLSDASRSLTSLFLLWISYILLQSWTGSSLTYFFGNSDQLKGIRMDTRLPTSCASGQGQ